MRVPPDLVIVASAFVKLQDARHAADYDLSRQFLRSEVLLFLIQTEEAITAWKRGLQPRYQPLFPGGAAALEADAAVSAETTRSGDTKPRGREGSRWPT
jgi:hypothetical protein